MYIYTNTEEALDDLVSYIVNMLKLPTKIKESFPKKSSCITFIKV